MADFQKYAPKLSKLEGGFSNRKADRGGPTNRGVTLRTFREFYGSDKTVEELRNMTDEQWTYIMKSGYWDKCKADEIKSQSVAEFFSDWCVNSGTGMIRKIQFLLGVKTDGIVGPLTLAAIDKEDPASLFERMKILRKKFVRTIVENDPRQIENLDGWINRINSFKFES